MNAEIALNLVRSVVSLGTWTLLGSNRVLMLRPFISSPLRVQVRRRLPHGFVFIARYSWMKSRNILWKEFEESQHIMELFF